MIRLSVALFLLGAGVAMAGGGPQQVLVVVNDADTDSQELGHYYAEQRGIPQRNICHVSVDPRLDNMGSTDFDELVVTPIRQHLETYGLDEQIDFMTLCGDFPTRIKENESITSALYYGFKGAPKIAPPAFPCTMPPATRNPYFMAEHSFSQGGANVQGLGRLTTMLLPMTLAEAKQVVDRSVAADHTAPPGTFYMLKPPGDVDRNVRYKLFDEFTYAARFHTSFPAYQQLAKNEIRETSNIMGYMTGLPNFSPTFWNGNTFLPGALADHLTSFGARFPEPTGNQDTIDAWIRAGAAGSYGTVAEPCAFVEKYPHPLLFYWYARGFNLAESYYMSVAYPYHGLIVGDPLTAPYAKPPAVRIEGVAAHEEVSGVVTVRVEATRTEGAPCRAIDMYVDDLFMGTVTNAPPTAWNTVDVTVNQHPYTYIVNEGDTLFDVVSGLSDMINRTESPIKSVIFGDRLMLLLDGAGLSGSTITYEAKTAKGLSSRLSVYAQALTTNFLDSIAYARKELRLYGTAAMDDRVVCRVTLKDGATAEEMVICKEGEAASDVLQNLYAQLESNEQLQAVNGVRAVDIIRRGAQAAMVIQARTAGPDGVGIRVEYEVTPAKQGVGLNPQTAFSGYLVDNAKSLVARGTVLFSCGSDVLTGTHVWDTASLPDGEHTVRMVAREGSAVATQGHALVPLRVNNTGLMCSLAFVGGKESAMLGERVALRVAMDEERKGIDSVIFYAEGKPLKDVSKEPFSATLDTTDYGPGRIDVRALVQMKSGQRVLSDPRRLTITRNEK